MGSRLTGKVAIVTGAGQGFGREEALGLAREGAKVVVNDLGVTFEGQDGDKGKAQRVVNEIRANGGEAVPCTESAATMSGAERIVQTAIEAFGRLDILVNNATVFGMDDLWIFSEDDWDRTLAVNLKGYFATIRYAAPHFCQQRSGVIVNTSSPSGFGHPSMVAYVAAKEGVVGLTRTVACELGRFGVRCNAIRPRGATEGARAYPERAAKWVPLISAVNRVKLPASIRMTGGSPVGDEFAPSKVATFVVWLCTDAAANANGRTFFVAGDRVGLFEEPELASQLVKPGGWDLDSLDSVARDALIGDLSNAFLLEGHPEFHEFK